MSLYADRALLEAKKVQNFQTAINEAYFGRMAINNLYNAYCDWREPLVTSSKYWTLPIAKDVYNDNMKRFREAVCKQFGFRTFSYAVLPTATINSFTITSHIPGARHLNTITVDRKNGYRFKDEAMVSCFVAVYPAMAFNPEFTSEECFAIFLHEVGHNFQTAANGTICWLNFVEDFVGLWNLLTAIIANDFTIGAFNKVSNALADTKGANMLYNIIAPILYTLTKIKNFSLALSNMLAAPVNLLMNFFRNIERVLLRVLSLGALTGYLGERFADGFPASYGFGEAQATALEKIDGVMFMDPMIDDLVNKMPLFGHIMNLAMLPGLMLFGLIDVHPSTASRCYSMIKDLKTDLNDPTLSPEMKKQLKKDIDKYEATMTKFFNENTKLENPRVVPNLLQKWSYEHGGDLKFKISELPFSFNTNDGLRASTNRTMQSQINNTDDRFKII